MKNGKKAMPSAVWPLCLYPIHSHGPPKGAGAAADVQCSQSRARTVLADAQHPLQAVLHGQHAASAAPGWAFRLLPRATNTKTAVSTGHGS